MKASRFKEDWRTVPAPCGFCGKLFIRRKSVSIYCSSKCSQANSEKLHGFEDQPEPYSSGTVGAIYELRIATDLMLKGWYIFRALSPNGPVDLVAIKEDKILRVQVRKARRYRRSGRIAYRPPKDTHSYDLLALCLSDGSTIYIPEIV